MVKIDGWNSNLTGLINFQKEEETLEISLTLSPHAHREEARKGHREKVVIYKPGKEAL